ncbi:MAG TPA: hypothetical protein GXX20_10305 [Clostridiaceae bacterium]|nr:hypothetical protein [Clostridiaceae bacterium]
MIDLYYYIPINDVEYVVDCGLKLSKWFDREELIEGQYKKCITALLNPKDDIEKYNSEHLVCVKLEVEPEHCFVGDKYLFNTGLRDPEIMILYRESIIPVKDYIFGSYRLPECLVTTTVIGGNISILNKNIDSPVLFNNSEELYINNILEYYKETEEDFCNTALYYYHMKLVECGKFRKFEDVNNRTTIFIDNFSGKPFIFKVPDLSYY